MTKVAILFYGLSRTLEKTIHSLKENLFEPLKDHSIEYDIFVHTYKIFGPYNNVWSGEKTDNYNNEDIELLLNPTHFIYDNQETIINSINFEEYYKYLDWPGSPCPEMTKYLIRNLCLALYSKKQITLLFDEKSNEYDYAIIIRPDTLLLNKIDVQYFNELNDTSIIIPEKDWYLGCNDRICIGKPNIVSYYGKLFDDLKMYSNEKNIISERYLLDKLNENSITIIPKHIDYWTLRIEQSHHDS